MLPFLYILMAVTVPQAAQGLTNHIVYWNSTNPIFRLDNADHRITVNQGNRPSQYDQLHLICPTGSEHHVIYSVSREEYEACRVTSASPRIVAICSPASSASYFTITFRNFSPTPGGLEFRAGQSYYFISTSTSRDLHRRAGGYCSTHNMKMVFNIAGEAPPEIVTKSATVSENPPTAAASNIRTFPPRVRASFDGLNTAETSTDVVYKPSPVTRVRSSDYLYYYTPRDLLHLKLAVKKHLKSGSASSTAENDTWKAEKLKSSANKLYFGGFIAVLFSLLVIC